MGSKADISSPVEHLLTVRRIVDKHGTPEVKQWLSEGIDRAIFDGEDLGQALGLNSAGRGQESGLTLWRRYERDGFLRIGFSFIEGGNTSEKVERFRELIKKFEFSWPRYEKCQTPPESLGSGLWLALYKARKLGRIPGSVRQLREIVEEQEQ